MQLCGSRKYSAVPSASPEHLNCGGLRRWRCSWSVSFRSRTSTSGWMWDAWRSCWSATAGCAGCSSGMDMICAIMNSSAGIIPPAGAMIWEPDWRRCLADRTLPAALGDLHQTRVLFSIVSINKRDEIRRYEVAIHPCAYSARHRDCSKIGKKLVVGERKSPGSLVELVLFQ